jgi:hypothetical protein
MNSTYYITAFLKIGKEEHIDQLQKEGLLYCNTVKYFRKIESENNKLRKDTTEGATSSVKIDWMKLFLHNKELPIKITTARLHTFDEVRDLKHLYCLYAITPELATGMPFIDDRNVDFGDTGLIILKPPEFIKRIRKAINRKYKFDFSPVQYYSLDKDHEKLTVFHKQEFYSYQREFRFLFYFQSNEPLEIKIGSIEDISVKMEANKLNDLLLVKEKILENPE